MLEKLILYFSFFICRRCSTNSPRPPQLGAASVSLRDSRIGEQSGATDSGWFVRSLNVQDVERLHEQNAKDGIEGTAIRDRRFLRETRQRDD